MATDSSRQDVDYDVIVVGAGFAGLNALYRFRTAGYRVRVLESGTGVGGTWYWNRYPGARVDIESLEYSYGFSEEIQQEWNWPHRYSNQREVLEYLEWVTDRLELRKDITFQTHVDAAHWDEESGTWTLTTNHGQQLRAQYCVLGVGFLSATHWPDIPGIESFGGQLIHTGNWPHEGVDLNGKRVGVIGAGATTVQMLPEIVDDCGHLTLFQRTPNWCFPMRNLPMPEDYEAHVKRMYHAVRHLEHEWPGAGVVLRDMVLNPPTPATRTTFSVSAEEREAEFERRWQHDSIHLGATFSDLLTNLEANNTLRDFLERKIRSIVKDQDVATLLIPDHPPYTRRPCGQYGYFEVFNRDNVTLADAKGDPIVEITSSGVRQQSGATHELDILICATGFDAGTGGMTRIDLRGRGDVLLRDYWADGARTHLGLMSAGFPNMFFLNAVQSPSAFFSPPLLADYQITYALRLIKEAEVQGATSVEPSREAEAAWRNHVNEVIEGTLLPMANSWWMGANIPDKPRQAVAYFGGFPAYKEWAEAAIDGMRDFEFHKQMAKAG